MGIKRLIIVFLFFSLRLNAQDIIPFTLNFDLVYAKDSLKLEKYYPYREKDSLNITAFRFYISQIEFLQKGKIIFAEPNSYHLIDAEIKESRKLIISIPADEAIDNIRFYLGIDSLTNVSGAKGGDLDPTKGMYWTWQSGYINLKLEGNSNVCKTRKNEYTFHSGGYNLDQNALQTVNLPVNGNTTTVSFDLNQFFSAIDLDTFNHIMSPGMQSKLLSLLASKLFRTL
jgi:hypothetical protein